MRGYHLNALPHNVVSICMKKKRNFSWLRFTIVSLRCLDVEKLSHTPHAIKAVWILRALWKQTSAYAPHGFIVIVYFNVILLTIDAFSLLFRLKCIATCFGILLLPLFLFHCYSIAFIFHLLFLHVSFRLDHSYPEHDWNVWNVTTLYGITTKSLK